MNTQIAQWATHKERGSIFMLKVMTFISLRLGRPVSRVVLYGIAAYFFLFAPRARRAARLYLRRALGREPRALDRFRHVLTFATTIHDRVFLINDRLDSFQITSQGEALMEAAFRAGRGAFLMSAHVGSFEVVRSLGRRHAGLTVVMAMYEQNARKISAMLGAINPKILPKIIPVGSINSMLMMRECLEQGAFVGVMGDRRRIQEPVQSVPLLGAAAQLPMGPMRAAAALRYPVFFAIGLYRGANRYHIVFEPIADFAGVQRQQREAAVRAGIESYARLLEQYCRSDPYNWFNFYDFWDERRESA
jgi:predicted LPLAT superfamily acyltransferase